MVFSIKDIDAALSKKKEKKKSSVVTTTSENNDISKAIKNDNDDNKIEKKKHNEEVKNYKGSDVKKKGEVVNNNQKDKTSSSVSSSTVVQKEIENRIDSNKDIKKNMVTTTTYISMKEFDKMRTQYDKELQTLKDKSNKQSEAVIEVLRMLRTCILSFDDMVHGKQSATTSCKQLLQTYRKLLEK